MDGTITVDAVREQLIKLGRSDLSDARIEEFLRQRRPQRRAHDDESPTGAHDDFKRRTAKSSDVLASANQRPPWNLDAFELLSLGETTNVTRRYPRRKSKATDTIGKVDVVKLGAEYRAEWAKSPLLSGQARPKVGFAEQFAALHEAERKKNLERRRQARKKSTM